MGIRVRVGEGAPAGSYKAGGVVWAGAGRLGRGRSLPTVGRRGGGREGQADRWSGRAGPGRGRFGGPCRAARQAELAAQARPGARAVLGPGPVTSGPCRAWAVPGRPCSGRANGPRAVSSSIAAFCTEPLKGANDQHCSCHSVKKNLIQNVTHVEVF